MLPPKLSPGLPPSFQVLPPLAFLIACKFHLAPGGDILIVSSQCSKNAFTLKKKKLTLTFQSLPGNRVKVNQDPSPRDACMHIPLLLLLASPLVANGSIHEAFNRLSSRMALHQKKDPAGYELLKTPLLNKGLGFTEEERVTQGLTGLLPPAYINLVRSSNPSHISCSRFMMIPIESFT